MAKTLPKPSWRQLLTNPDHFFAFGFGAGLAPWAPGTFGTLAAIPLYWLISDLSAGIYLSVLVVGFALGVFWCERSSRALGVHDHPGIVWDEIVGYWITMFLAPAGPGWIALGFVLFRLFDIAKPWPVSLADKNVGGGLGIMVDDVLAGLYAFLVMQVCVWSWARWDF